mmetsp:Transcript_57525/g.168461  ORF Transcript_57525/g.168461 Transcript_57525/m.168461 type:complete len:313 (-) Transcript_57525:48-986(-)
MSHRNDTHHRRMAHSRRMSAVPDEIQVQSVLFDTAGLKDAHRRASDDGRRHIDGLYHDGERVEEIPAHWTRKTGNAMEAQKEVNMGKVARAHNSRQQQRTKKCQRLKKTEEQMEDEEAAKKSKAILDQSTKNETLLYDELFSFFDVDSDRTWGSIEFAQRMTDIGCGTSAESAANLLYFAGVRNVDRITYDDFIQMMPKLKAFRVLLEKEAMRAFAAYDVQGTGFLSRHALREVVRALAGPDGISDEQVHYIVKKSDTERTGRIPFAFFIRALFGTPPVLVYTPKPRKKSLLASLFGCGTSGNHEEEEFKLD